MIGTARFLLVSVGLAGAAVLLWLSARPDETAVSGYIASTSALAGAGAALGLAITLSATMSTLIEDSLRGAAAAAVLLVSLAVFAGLWVLAAHAPTGVVTRDVRNWTGDVGILGIVDDLEQVTPTVAFGVGVLLASLLALVVSDRRRTTKTRITRSTRVADAETTAADPETIVADAETTTETAGPVQAASTREAAY
jgi:hypothetical protein